MNTLANSRLKRDVELGKTHVVPNAVDALFLSGELAARPAKGALTFINVALLNPGKRHDILIDAFRRAFGSATKNTLYIVGDGTERMALERRIAAYGMGSSIRLLGLQPKSRVAELLVDSDCFVLTSDHETFGVVVTEALASGLPVISTKCGGTDDIVMPQNGIMVDAGHVRAVAEAMTTMQKRIEQEFYIRENIRAGCMEKFSPHAVCAMLVKIYADAVR